MKSIMPAMLCLSGLALSAGCWRVTTPDGTAQVSVDGRSATVDIAGPAGGRMQVGDNVTLPPDFPKDVPTPAGAVPKVVSNLQGALSVMFEVETPLSKVSDFYAAELPKQGWKLTVSSREEESSLFSCEKEKRLLTVALHRNDQATNVQLTVVTKPD